MAVEIGALRAMLSLDSAAFERGARRAEASMGNLQRRLSRLGQGMRRFGRSMSTRVTAPLVLAAGAAVRSSLQIVDAQAKLAQTLDTSVVSIQNLTRAASLSGISQEELEGSLTRMTRRISLAAQETGPAVDALDRLGLSAENLNDLPVDQRVDRITSAIRDLIPEAEQAGIASQIFGDRTGLAIMRLDSDVIARATEEVERFGVAISETDADQIEATNDALSAMGLVTKGIANQLTVALAPALQSMAERLADVAVWFKSLSPEMRKFTGIAVAVAAAIGPIAIAIGFMATGFAALASPIGLAIFALGAAAGAAAYVWANWDTLSERFPVLAEGMNRVGNVFKEVWEFIKTLVVGAADIVNGALEAIVGLLTGDLKVAVEGLKTMWQGWSDIVDGAMQAVLGIIQAIVPGFVTAVDDIIDAVSELPEKLKQWGIDAVQGFVDGIVERWNALKDSVTGIFRLDGVSAPDLSDAYGPGARERSSQTGQDIGSDLGNGVALGLDNSAGAIADSASELSDYLEDTLQTENEIQSPSRRWMRIGQDLMAGLGLGISGGVDAAVEAAQGAAEGVTGALSGVTGAFDSIGQSFKTILGDMLLRGRSFADSMSGILSGLSTNLFSAGFDGLWNVVTASIPGFSEGGKTPGGVAQVAGVVHGQEFVTRAAVVRKPGVLPFLEALNNGDPGAVGFAAGLPGYRGGGLVASGMPASSFAASPSQRVVVEGGDLTLTDGGQIMAQVRVRIAEGGNEAVTGAVRTVGRLLASDPGYGAPS